MKIATVKSTETLSLVVGVFLLLLLLLMNYPSTGVIRSDDEGSGIGGTGRAAEPGSGLGGTGLKPFLGLSTQSEIEILRSAEQRDSAITASIESNFEPEKAVEHAIVQPLFKLVSDTAITYDSSSITIAESIQHASNNNAVYFQQLQQIADQLDVSVARSSTADSNSDQKQSLLDQPLELAGDLTTTAIPESNIESAVMQASMPAAIELSQPDANDDTASWKAFALLLTKNAPTQTAERSTASAQEISVTASTTKVLSRPEKIQRPELPPIQRLRPIQRASILPPRIKPLRL